MNKGKFTTVIGSALLVLAAAGNVYAAENAEGVKEHMAKTLEVAKQALEAAKAGNREECLAKVAATKQHYKEITGDAAGMPLQKAMKTLREGQNLCEGIGANGMVDASKADVKSAIPLIEDAVKQMEPINAKVQAGG